MDQLKSTLALMAQPLSFNVTDSPAPSTLAGPLQILVNPSIHRLRYHVPLQCRYYYWDYR